MRGVADARGLRDIRSMHSGGGRSIPGVQRSGYLDLYMLRKQEERLEREAALLDKRARGIQKRLGDIRRQMEKLELSAPSHGRAARDGASAMPGQPARQKQWKRFSTEY